MRLPSVVKYQCADAPVQVDVRFRVLVNNCTQARAGTHGLYDSARRWHELSVIADCWGWGVRGVTNSPSMQSTTQGITAGHGA